LIALLIVVPVLSTAFFGAVLYKHLPFPTRSLYGRYSDHYANWGSVALFAEHGFEIYKKPLSELCPPPSQSDLDQANVNHIPDSSICPIYGKIFRRTVFINWPQYPRPYPPGFAIFFAPEALLFSLTELSFSNVNLITIMHFVFFAHIAFLVFLLCAFFENIAGKWKCKPNPVWGFFILPFIFVELLSWSFQGQYDAVAVLFVVLSIWFAKRKEPVNGILAFSVAFFLHFRAIWWVPVIFFGFIRKHSRPVNLINIGLKLMLSLILLLSSLYVFYLLQPALHSYPVSNPQHFSLILEEPIKRIFAFYVPTALILIFLAWSKSKYVYVGIIWQATMILQTPEVHEWHRLFLLPVFALCTLEDENTQHSVLLAAFMYYILEITVIFGGNPLTFSIFPALLR
jgi:hypothetical protein